jgi:hypothetical protein
VADVLSKLGSKRALVPAGVFVQDLHKSSIKFMLTDKRCTHLRSASIRTYTFFTTGFPGLLSIRGARGLQAFDLPLLTNYLNPIYG